MAPAPVRTGLQALLKLFNFILAVMGIAMVFYSVLMLNEWRKDSSSPSPPSAPPPSSDDAAVMQYFGALATSALPDASNANLHFVFGDTTIELPAPWFIYAFLGAGILICVVTFSGAVAAEIHSKFCLSFYQFGVAFMLVAQVLLAAYLFFDKSWDKDIPDDPTGELKKMKEFVQKNITLLKWFGLAVLIVQLVAIVLAMILHTVSRAKDDERAQGDEEVAVRRLREPLLPPDAPPGQYVIDYPAPADVNRGDEKKKGKW